MASASYDGLVRVWDIDARQVVGEAKLGGAVTTMAFDSTGQQLAAGRADGQLFVLQIPGQSEPQPATAGSAEKAPRIEKALE